MERPFQHCDVSEQLGQVLDRRAAAIGQQDEGKVRPGRLLLDPRGKCAAVGPEERLLRDHRAG